jgi:hypothetical protein
LRAFDNLRQLGLRTGDGPTFILWSGWLHSLYPDYSDYHDYISRTGLAASNFSIGKGLSRLCAADAEKFARNCGDSLNLRSVCIPSVQIPGGGIRDILEVLNAEFWHELCFPVLYAR